MKNASDFRTLAREALRGKWGIAVLAGFLATLLGSTSGAGPEIKLNYTGHRTLKAADGGQPLAAVLP